jgi:ferredoxin
MAYTISSLCNYSGNCRHVCPVDCIVPGPMGDPVWGHRYYIDPETCVDCDACVVVCPTGAIFSEESIPGAFLLDQEVNEAFFSEGPGYWEEDS